MHGYHVCYLLFLLLLIMIKILRLWDKCAPKIMRKRYETKKKEEKLQSNNIYVFFCFAFI